MSWDPNAPVIQNAYVLYSEGGAFITGAIVGKIRVLRLECWKRVDCPTLQTFQLQAQDHDTAVGPVLASITSDNVPVVGSFIMDFEGAIIAENELELTTGATYCRAKVTYTID